jgi:hypothetical protein
LMIKTSALIPSALQDQEAKESIQRIPLYGLSIFQLVLSYSVRMNVLRSRIKKRP